MTTKVDDDEMMNIEEKKIDTNGDDGDDEIGNEKDKQQKQQQNEDDESENMRKSSDAQLMDKNDAAPTRKGRQFKSSSISSSSSVSTNASFVDPLSQSDNTQHHQIQLKEYKMHRCSYLGSATINAPRSEAEIQRNMIILNESTSRTFIENLHGNSGADEGNNIGGGGGGGGDNDGTDHLPAQSPSAPCSRSIEVTMCVPTAADGVVVLHELQAKPRSQSESGYDYSDSLNAESNNSSNVIASFPISRIIFCARGKPDSAERNCFAFTCSHGQTFETGLLKCHVFRCESPDVVAKILQCFAVAFRRVPTPNSSGELMTAAFEASLEIKEEDPSKPGSLTTCPRDKDHFKLRSGYEKKVCVTLTQDWSRSRGIGVDQIQFEKCFGMLLSPGRNVRHGDMIPIGLLSMTRNVVTIGQQQQQQQQPQQSHQYYIIGTWNPNEPNFELLNSETPRDTRVFLTIAVDLIVTGIREPVRFVFETKAKVVGTTNTATDRFGGWLAPAAGKLQVGLSQIANNMRSKSMQEQFYLHVKELSKQSSSGAEHEANDTNLNKWEVISCYSLTQLARKKNSLALSLKQQGQQQQPRSNSLPTPSSVQGDNDDANISDGDEPLLSGTGEVSKDVSASELSGWSEILAKWQSNLSSRPRGLAPLVRRGVPEALRGEVWQLLAGSHDDKQLMDTYRILITKESACEAVIQRDINRTFPAHEFFRDSGSLGQDSLLKLCKAYAVHDEEIGYCQGLTFISAALLLHMPEEQAFCVLHRIMKDYGLRNVFRCGFEELHMKFYCLERLMDEQIPELLSHFADLGVEAHMYASQWFLTLFTAKFPLHVVFNILDVFLLDGMDTMFQVALALLQLSKMHLLALDFEGCLKYFRVQLPKRYRSDEAAKELLRTAVGIKLKKLKRYEKEYVQYKEANKAREDPVEALQKENKRLLENNMRLDQENDDLAHELVNSKIALRADLDVAEDRAEAYNKELLNAKTTLVELEDEKKRLEVEVTQLKEMCRRELQRAESEISRNANIIADYKQICSQLSTRLEQEQLCSRKSLEAIVTQVKDCERCAKLVADSGNSSELNGVSEVDGGTVNGAAGATLPGASSKDLEKQVRELELELAQTKLALVETECKNQDLIHQLGSTQSELLAATTKQGSTGKWFSKTLSSIREATNKKDTSSNSSQGSSLSRENSKDFSSSN